MRYRFQTKLILGVLVIVGFKSIGQSQTNAIGWEKIISREIEIGGSADSSGSHAKGVSLTEMMVNAIMDGKVVGYSNLDMSLNTRLSAYERSDISGSRVDTQEIMDPITGQWIRKYIHRGVDYAAIHRFRILEHWTFDPLHFTTAIQIIGIAPVREVYGDDGVFRGNQGLLWLHYAEAIPILEKYNKAHADHTIKQILWNDYFSNPAKPENKEGAWQANAIRLIYMPEQKEDQVQHHLRDQSSDSSLLDILTNAKYSGNLSSYTESEYGDKKALAPHDFSYPGVIRMDTVFIGNKEAGVDLGNVARPVYAMGEKKVKIREVWTFDPSAGKTTIEIEALAPVIHVAGNIPELMTMYWSKFGDVNPIVIKYDSYHPFNSFAGRIWDNYFLSDVRPSVVK